MQHPRISSSSFNWLFWLVILAGSAMLMTSLFGLLPRWGGLVLGALLLIGVVWGVLVAGLRAPGRSSPGQNVAPSVDTPATITAANPTSPDLPGDLPDAPSAPLRNWINSLPKSEVFDAQLALQEIMDATEAERKKLDIGLTSKFLAEIPLIEEDPREFRNFLQASLLPARPDGKLGIVVTGKAPQIRLETRNGNGHWVLVLEALDCRIQLPASPWPVQSGISPRGQLAELSLRVAGSVPTDVAGPVPKNSSLASTHGKLPAAKVLVLEDEFAMADILRMMLEQHGLEVTICQHPQEALERISRDGFDVVITDYRMPQMTGDIFIAEAKQLLAHLPGPHPHFLLVTGDPSRQGGSASGYEVLEKPFSEQRLIELVASWLRP